MDKALHESILKITRCQWFICFWFESFFWSGRIGRNLPTSFGQIPTEMMQPEGQMNPHIILIIQQDKEVEELENHGSHMVQSHLHTTATNSESWFNAKGQLVIRKVPWATLMKMMAEYSTSAKPSTSENPCMAPPPAPWNILYSPWQEPFPLTPPQPLLP